MAASYTVRRSALEKPLVWSLEDGALVRRREGARDRRWALSGLRRVTIAKGGNRYAPGRATARLAFRDGVVQIGSHGFHGLGRFDDQSAAFSAFIRQVCAEGVTAAPAARFDTGAPTVQGMMLGVGALLAGGVVVLLLSSLMSGVFGLGVEIAARLFFMLCLLVAFMPWIGDARAARFDPRAIPPEVLG